MAWKPIMDKVWECQDESVIVCAVERCGEKYRVVAEINFSVQLKDGTVIEATGGEERWVEIPAQRRV